MPWERYDKDGQPPTRILVAALGTEGVEAELELLRSLSHGIRAGSG